MTRDGGRAKSTRGRGRGALEPIVSLLPTAVSPPIQSPVSIGSPADLPIPSPSNSNAPPTSSSVAGSSTGCDLTIIHVEDERLIPSHTCSSTMTKIFMKMIHPNGYAWKNVPNEYKDLYFEEFKDESIEAQVRKVFLAQACLRYADMLSKFKTKRTSTGRPACVAEETWAIWEAYWDRPDVKEKSKQQRKNRMSEVEGPGTGCSKHTGGSRSTIDHYHKLRDELQKEPNLFECFKQMHKKNDGMFVDERSKRIAEEIQARHDAATQEAEGSTESPNIDMSQLTSCGSSATSQLHQDTMKEMLNQQLETMRAEMDAKLQAERAEMEAKLQAQMQAQIASLMDELRRNGIISTSMALPQNTKLNILLTQMMKT
nr:ABC transporter B family member 11 [Ipomoea batatas]